MFNTLSTQEFINDYWQQQPLYVANTLPEIHQIIDGDFLAGLACEDDVEARIIRGHGLNNDWSCLHGPFDENTFAELPEKNWTLLVQGLEQWDENIHALMQRFDFLPRWRLEDMMASYAVKGGGVGPHFDYYDVFLLQVSGEREWHLGQACDETSPLIANNQVKLLADFSIEKTYPCTPGDLLYIPAGCAHWGTALTDNCITLSVGFRAPSQKEIVLAAMEDVTDQLSDTLRYQDAPNTIEANPDKINRAVSSSLQAMQPDLVHLIRSACDKAFGRLVTEPRHLIMDDEPVGISRQALKNLSQQQGGLELALAAGTRMAFSDEYLFVNGEAYACQPQLASALCEGHCPEFSSEEELALVHQLIEVGHIKLNSA